MYILLDSNVILADPSLDSVSFKKLRVHLRKSSDKLVVPEAVIREVVSHMGREIADKCKPLSELNKCSKYYWREDILDIDVIYDRRDSLLKQYDKRLRTELLSMECLILDYKELSISGAFERFISRTWPFGWNDKRKKKKRDFVKDEGDLGDLLVWQGSLELLEKYGDVALISGDSDFTEEDGSLRAELAEEASRFSNKITVFKNLGQFVEKASPSRTKVDWQWIKSQLAYQHMLKAVDEALIGLGEQADRILSRINEKTMLPGKRRLIKRESPTVVISDDKETKISVPMIVGIEFFTFPLHLEGSTVPGLLVSIREATVSVSVDFKQVGSDLSFVGIGRMRIDHFGDPLGSSY